MSFIFKITTTTSPQTFVIPCVDEGTFNATVDYGDGTGSQTVTAYNDSNLTHSFATAGQHTITIDGTFPNIRFNDNAASRILVDEVVDLGDVGWTFLYQAFRGCTNLTVFNSGTANTSSVTSMQQMFHTCTNLTALNVSSFDTSSVTTMQAMFHTCQSLTTLGVSNFDTSSVTNMQAMFQNCTSLTSLGVSSFNTSSVTNMGLMFRACSSLTSLNVSSFDTSSITNMGQMFYNCNSLTTLDVSNFDTSSVNNMQEMFYSCSSLTALDLSSFDTASVVNMSYMFTNCYSLTNLDLSNFDTSSVTGMVVMFQNCYSLTNLDLSNFNTSSVTSISYMFQSCSSLTTLDVSNFDTSSVTSMRYTFYGCSSLTTLDINHFDVSSVTDGTGFLQYANNALTTTQYNELLEAWAAQDVQPNVAWHFGNAQYTVETIADWYSPRNASSLSIINNKLVSIADSTATFGVAQQIDNLVVGSVYSFIATATCNNNSATVSLVVSASADVTSPIFNKQAAGGVTANDTFTATATTHYVGTIVTGHAANDTVTIDAGITVKEITNYTEANAASEIEYSQENVFGADIWTNPANNIKLPWVYSGPNIYSIDGSQTVTTVIALFSATEFGSTYQVNFKIENYGNGGLQPAVGSDGASFGQQVSANGSYSQVITKALVGGNTSVQFRANSDFSGTLIVESIKKITNAVTYQNIAQDVRDTYTLIDDTWVGSELVVNGDFATDSDWTKGTGVTISAGKAVMVSVGANALYQNSLPTSQALVKVTFDIVDYVSGNITCWAGGGQTSASNESFSTVGRKELIITPAGNGNLIFGKASLGSAFTGSIDNVSVKRLIQTV